MIHSMINAKLRDIRFSSYLWLILTIIGNPFYNIFAFLICAGLGLIKKCGSNTIQANIFAYVFILIILFFIRLIMYYLFFNRNKPIKVNLLLFTNEFVIAHQYQLLGTLTFFIWTLEIEGNVAGFILVPITIISILVLLPIQILQLLKAKKRILEIINVYQRGW